MIGSFELDLMIQVEVTGNRWFDSFLQHFVIDRFIAISIWSKHVFHRFLCWCQWKKTAWKAWIVKWDYNDAISTLISKISTLIVKDMDIKIRLVLYRRGWKALVRRRRRKVGRTETKTWVHFYFAKKNKQTNKCHRLSIRQSKIRCYIFFVRWVVSFCSAPIEWSTSRFRHPVGLRSAGRDRWKSTVQTIEIP